jgi:phosphate acyltransferase
VRLAIDVMGGDHAPQAPIQAVLELAGSSPDVLFTLIGDESKMATYTTGKRFNNIELVHAPDVIDPGEEPVRAVRRKTESSLVRAATMVQQGEADVMVSAGNTGALVAAGLLILGRIQGIERPALAPALPTFAGTRVLLLDAGATMDASAKNLLQYATMADIYSRYVLGIAQPRIGLLNVGTEPGKGNGLTKAAFTEFEQAPFHFVGNVEARDLLDGVCDVAVCDGFVGNVVLKLVEGIGLGMFSALRDTLKTAPLPTKLGALMVKPALRGFRDRFDYAEYGGAPFLGVAGGCIKAHGSSNPRAWYTSLCQAIQFCEQSLLNKIEAALAAVEVSGSKSDAD